MNMRILVLAAIFMVLPAVQALAASEGDKNVPQFTNNAQCVERTPEAKLKGEIEAFFATELATGKSMEAVIAAALAKFSDPADVLLVARKQGAPLSALVASGRQAKVDDDKIARIATQDLCLKGSDVASAMGRSDLPGLGYTPAGGPATGAGRNSAIGGTPGGGNVSKSTGTPVSPSTF